MRRFADACSDADVIPVETSILIFRRLLEKYQLTTQLFSSIKAHLCECGLVVGRRTIVGTSILQLADMRRLSITHGQTSERGRLASARP